MRSFFVRLLVLVATAVSLSTTQAAIFGVSMQNTQFLPKDLTIDRGDTVIWRNEDPFQHDTVSGVSGEPSGDWDSKEAFNGNFMEQGQQFSHTFTTPGTYPYYCTPHWDIFNMVGTITVRAGSSIPIVTITSPEFDQSFPPNTAVTIHATATDTDGIAKVDFFLNGTFLGTDTTAPYSFTTAALGVGTYSIEVKATDNFESVGSTGIDITVNGALPTITLPPRSLTVVTGSVATLTVTATGTAPLSYQWSFKSTNITGATKSALTLTNVRTNQSGTYLVRVSNGFGFAEASATLIVTNVPPGSRPTIVTQPASRTVTSGTNASFTVVAIGSSPLRYQWFFNNGRISAATNSFVSFRATATNAGNYFAIVSNAFGKATSSVARLTVPAPCTYNVSPLSTAIFAVGGSRTVTVTTGPTCAWRIVNTNSWIIVAGVSFTGSRTVSFSVQPNTSANPRSGNIRVAGKVFTISQGTRSATINSDLNSDGDADLLWQTPSGEFVFWFMTQTNLQFDAGSAFRPAGWRGVATIGYDAGSTPDILMQHTDGTVALWRFIGGKFVKLIVKGPSLGSSWALSSTADLNSDGKTDFLFRHRDGYLLMWKMNGTNFVSQSFLFNADPIPSDWRIVATADLSGDSKPDILWQHDDGAIVLWTMTGSVPTVSTSITGPSIPAGARINGVADMNGDAKNDLIWRKTDGRLFAWLMNRTNFLRTATVAGTNAVPADWKLVSPRN